MILLLRQQRDLAHERPGGGEILEPERPPDRVRRLRPAPFGQRRPKLGALFCGETLHAGLTFVPGSRRIAAMPNYTLPPAIEDIAELGEQALGAIPAPLRAKVRGVTILVEDAADDQTVAELGLDNAWELTGLYRGIPFGQASGAVPHAPDLIVLYREPILLEWIETGEDLFRLVRTVLIHEIAHHFGFSDDDIATLEAEE